MYILYGIYYITQKQLLDGPTSFSLGCIVSIGADLNLLCCRMASARAFLKSVCIFFLANSVSFSQIQFSGFCFPRFRISHSFFCLPQVIFTLFNRKTAQCDFLSSQQCLNRIKVPLLRYGKKSKER